MAVWDVVVVGGGAAGLTASAAVAQSGLSCLLIDQMGGGGELMNLGVLHDLHDPLTGPDLCARLLDDAMTAGADQEITQVTGLAPIGDLWRITAESGVFDARTVILAIGLAPGRLGLDGEDDFEGIGLSHCAACDGPLYRDQPVVVAGADRWAVHEARELAGYGCQTTLVTQGLTQPPPADGFTVLPGRITALRGAPALQAVIITADDHQSVRLPAQAVFVQSGRRPSVDFVAQALARDPDGRLITTADLQCSLPNLFAAGDARAGNGRTLISAMEDGRHAAASARAALMPHR